MRSLVPHAGRLAPRLVTAAVAVASAGALAAAHAAPDAIHGVVEERTPAPSGAPGAPAPASPTPVPGREAPEALVGRVLLLLAERMPGPDHEVRARVAEAVVTESALAGIDPLLVLAVIHVESTFDPDAVSPHGAAGLMQLKRGTMREVRERAGLPPADPRDPVACVQTGVRYLDHLLASFPGLDAALMAYNAGPGRIRDHLRRGEVPPRLRGYPLRVRAELARLRLSFSAVAAPGAPGRRQG